MNQGEGRPLKDALEDLGRKYEGMTKNGAGSMRYEVVVQPVAEAELEDAYRYIWKDSPERAARWRVKLLMMAETSSRMPQRCSLAPENDAFVEEIRQLLFGSYRLLFMILDEPREVHIVHIRHAKRRRL